MDVRAAERLKVGDIVIANRDGSSSGVRYYKGQLGLIASKEGAFFSVRLYEDCKTGIVFEESWDVIPGARARNLA